MTSETEPSAMMTKSDTIEAIKKLNPTASPEFLAGFSADELARYLNRLDGQSPHAIDRRETVMTYDPFPHREQPADAIL